MTAAAASATEFTGYATTAWPYVSLLLLLLATGVAAWVASLLWTARLLHKPPRLTPARSLARLGRADPADLGLPYERRTFTLLDGDGPERIELVAFDIPASGRRRGRCVLLHGYGDSKSGALAWAGVWRSLGFDVLLPDLRAHGESGGTFSTGGVLEPHDVAALVDQLGAERVVLVGISFGGVVAARAAALRPSVLGVVVDSPVLNWADSTARWGELFALPPSGALSHRLRLRLARRWFGIKAGDPPIDATLAALACPLLAILPMRDALLDAEDCDRVADAATVAWRVDAGHNLPLAADAPAYRARLEAFVETLANE